MNDDISILREKMDAIEIQKEGEELDRIMGNLEESCRTVDQAEIITDDINKIFSDNMNSFKGALDKRILAKTTGESMLSIVKLHIDDLIKRKKKIEDMIEQIDREVIKTIQNYPGFEYRGTLGTFMLHKNPTRLVIDEKELPEMYCRFEKRPNREAIVKAISSGLDVKGVTTEQGQHLRLIKETNANE